MEAVVTKHSVDISEALLKQLNLSVEKATIVHCKFWSNHSTRVRIWPQTILKEDSGLACKLIHAIDIPLNPEYSAPSEQHSHIYFTLIFEKLSADCKKFTLLESIPEPGGFYSKPVNRNQTDVYRIGVFS